MKWFFLLVLLAVPVVAVSCSLPDLPVVDTGVDASAHEGGKDSASNEGADGSGSADTDVQTFCTSVAEAECQEAANCTAVDGAQCETYRQSICMQGTIIVALTGSDTLSRTYTAANSKACIDALNSAFRQPQITYAELFGSGKLVDTCERVFVGNAGTGGACATDYDCATSGEVCTAAPEQPRQCATPQSKTLNATCADPGDECAADSYCAPGSSKCVAAQSVGQSCSPTELCDSGNRCVSGICAALAGLGDLCNSNADCGGDLLCDLYTDPTVPSAACVSGYTFSGGSVDCLGFVGSSSVGICPAGTSDAGAAEVPVLPACGGITIATPPPNCELLTAVDCNALCVPTSFDLACAAQLEIACSTGCTAIADATCEGSCESRCAAGCSTSPSSFSCSDYCGTDCDGQCQAQCPSDANQSQCTASCQATCAATCSTDCNGTPAACTPVTCQDACMGSCLAQANFGCDISCHEQGAANCASVLQGNCTTQCAQPQGALFCDGQYIFASDQSACIAQIAATYGVQVLCSP